MRKILFLCMANSIRSQMAEGLARQMFGDRATVQSAGSQASYVHPLAIKVMKEIEISIAEQESKSVLSIDPKTVDLVITLCQEEVCPAFFGQAEQLHWPMPDPVRGGGDREAILERFRQVRNMIQSKLKELQI